MMVEIALLLVLASGATPHEQAREPAANKGAKFKIPRSRIAYVKKEMTKNGLTRGEVEEFFGDERMYARRREPPGPSKPISWQDVERYMMAPESVERGKKFLKTRSEVLELARERHGVPPENVAAILRIETNFGSGKFLGSYPVTSVFYGKLGSRKKSKWKNAADNLVSFALYCKEMNKKADWDCHGIKGSYAGAFGIPQFMPLSLRYAEDGDGDGVTDMFNMEDAIMSVANFLEKHGWRENEPQAIARYYGEGGNYVRITQKYAAALRKQAAEH